jgi:hypothetical protein
MRAFLGAAIASALVGCSLHGAPALTPGVASEADVEARMGPSSDRLQTKQGETVRYYSRLPSGRAVYAARFGADGKLIALEQRLTRENVRKIVVGAWRADDVRALLGPPYETLRFPRLRTELWTYPMRDIMANIVANIEFGADGLVREVVFLDEPASD